MLFWKRTIVIFFIACCISISCRTLSNRIEMNTLTCGEDYKGDDNFFVVHDPEGRRLTRNNFDIVTVGDPDISLKSSSKGCIQKPSQGEFLLKSRENDWARVIKADELQTVHALSLFDYGNSTVTVSCDEKIPRHINQKFKLQDLIIQNLTEEFKQGYEIRFDVLDGDSLVIAESLLSLNQFGNDVMPFAIIQNEKEYILRVTVRNLMKGRETVQKKCRFYLDRTPPESNLAISGKTDYETRSVAGIDEVGLVELGSVVSFSSDSPDVGEIGYCSERIDATMAFSRSDRENRECESNRIQLARPNSPIMSEQKSGMWRILFYAVDRLGNRSITQSRYILYISSNTLQFANTIGFGEVSRLLYEGNTFEAAVNALNASALYLGFATSYEKNLTEKNVLVGLLKLVDRRTINFPLKSTRSGVAAVGFTPGGERFFSSDGPAVKIWDARSGKLIQTLEHTNGNQVVVLSTDRGGQFLAVGYPGSVSKIYSLKDYSLVSQIAPDSNFLSASAISPDGKIYATGASDGIVRTWDILSGRELASFGDGKSTIMQLAFSQSGNSLFSSAVGLGLTEWDYKTGMKKNGYSLGEEGINSFSSSPTTNHILIAPSKSDLEIWNRDDGTMLRKLDYLTATRVLDFADDQTFFTHSDDLLKFYYPNNRSVATGTQIGMPIFAKGLTVSPDRSQVLSFANTTTPLLLRNIIGDLRPLGFSSEESSGSRGLRFRSDGKQVRHYSKKLSIVWDHSSNEVSSTIDAEGEEGAEVTHLSKDGNVGLQSLGSDLMAFDFKTRTRIFNSKVCAEGDQLNRAIFMNDQKRIVVSCSSSWAIVNSSDGSLIRSYPSDLPIDVSLAVSSDDKTLYRGSYKGSVAVLDVNSGALNGVLEGHSQHIADMSLSKDGKRLVTASWDNSVKLWDLETKTLLKSFDGHKESFLAVTFALKDKLILAGGIERGLHIWDSETGDHLGKIQEDELTRVNSLGVSDDGEYLLVEDGSKFRAIDLNISRLTKRVCRAAKSTITNKVCEL